MQRTFWMVQGSGPANVRYTNVSEARTEAERLAKLNPGQLFFLMESVGAVIKNDVSWEPCDDRMELPF